MSGTRPTNRTSSNGSEQQHAAPDSAAPHQRYVPERDRNSTRKLRRRRTLMCLYAFLIVEFFAFLFFSPALTVRTVELIGASDTSALTAPELKNTQAAVQIPTRVNWLTVRTAPITARVSALPWIKSVSVSHFYPLGMRATVVMRTADYALVTPSGRYEMDSDNRAIRVLRPSSPGHPRLTQIVTAKNLAVQPGKIITSQLISAAAEILHSSQNDRILRLIGIHIDQNDNIWLNMDKGVQIRFGNDDQIQVKLAVLKRILTSDPATVARFAEINVSSAEYPAARLRDPNSGAGVTGP